MLFRSPNIGLWPRTEIEWVEGEGRVERTGLLSLDDGTCRVEPADALFVFIGTRPCKDWLPPNVLLDEKGRVVFASHDFREKVNLRALYQALAQIGFKVSAEEWNSRLS